MTPQTDNYILFQALTLNLGRGIPGAANEFNGRMKNYIRHKINNLTDYDRLSGLCACGSVVYSQCRQAPVRTSIRRAFSIFSVKKEGTLAMATEAQVTANRANAQLSSGPKTDEGKAKCSQNAVRHALTSRGLIVLPGLEDAFASLEQQFRISLQPLGEVEETIFKVILESAWNLERCRKAQGQLYAQAEDAGVDPLLDDAIEAKYSRIQKYARQYQNSMFKAMRELGRIQTEMQFRHQIHPLTAADVSDPDRFSRTPHAASAVCSLQQALQAAKSSRRPDKPIVQNRAKQSEEDFMAMLDRLTAPPSLGGKMMNQGAEAADDGCELDVKAA